MNARPWRSFLWPASRIAGLVRQATSLADWAERLPVEADTLLVGIVVGTVLVGVPVGVGTGYVIWGTQTAALAGELEKTKGWLMDEIAQSDARVKAAEDARPPDATAELARVRTELKKTQAELRQSRAAGKEAADDWRAERQRRRDLEARLAAQFRDCGAPASPSRR